MRIGPVSWRRLRWPTAIAAVAVALTLAAGIVAARTSTERPATPLRPNISGTVTVVNQRGSAFCLTDDADGSQFCSDVWQSPASAPLAVGEHVAGVVSRLDLPNGGWRELFVLTDTAPGP
jgi:hypothetical protein